MSHQYRTVKTVIEPKPVMEGAGVKLKRSLGGQELNYLDPFLLFDHFGSQLAEDYQAGFPMHPHRGIETVTYMLAGEVRHRDTLGNQGTIGAGDVQWMTAGGGILHEEMPQVRPEGNAGFQLWVNLPAKLKMTQPRYRDVSARDIPRVTLEDGAIVRIIAGRVAGTDGAVQDIAANPSYLDVSISPRGSFTQAIPDGHAAFVYVFEGRGTIVSADRSVDVSHTRFVVLENEGVFHIVSDNEPLRFLLVSAQPLNEPIARYGPFVMNTQEEIRQALADLRGGTFLWKKDQL